MSETDKILSDLFKPASVVRAEKESTHLHCQHCLEEVAAFKNDYLVEQRKRLSAEAELRTARADIAALEFAVVK